MKKASLASLIALFLSLPAAALAVPPTLSFQARIGDNGRPVTGSHSVKFAIWDCDGSDPATCVDPANVLWTETQTLTVSDGVLTAVLGADTTTPNPLPSALFSGGPIFLEVTFDGTAFSPRMEVHSVPFAMRADNLSGYPQTRYVTMAGGACAYPTTVTTALRQPLYCDMSDGTSNFTSYFTVDLPAGAVVRGLSIFAWATGTISCSLHQGLSNFGATIATASRTGTGFAFSPEAVVTHVVDNSAGYAVSCTATGSALDQALGAVRIRYTLDRP